MECSQGWEYDGHTTKVYFTKEWKMMKPVMHPIDKIMFKMPTEVEITQDLDIVKGWFRNRIKSIPDEDWDWDVGEVILDVLLDD